jgi:glyoxylase-like metal-dependent hydrolase (beta-lactamase superfamily II)
MPEQRIAFVGDALVPDQPPFLASANLPLWIESLRPLLTPDYSDYLLVSGRDGLIAHQQVRRQISYLEKTYQMLDQLASQKAPASETEQLVPVLLEGFEIPAQRELQYRSRLRYGLYHYYIRHYVPTEETVVE